MNNNDNSRSTIWTLADMISSYRFWGLLLFTALFMLGEWPTNYELSYFWQKARIWQSDSISVLNLVRSLSIPAGMFLAWFGLRRTRVYGLILSVRAFLIASILLILFPHSYLSALISCCLLGIAMGAVTLLVPAILSEGRGGPVVFVFAFGLITLAQQQSWILEQPIEYVHGVVIGWFIYMVDTINFNIPPTGFGLLPKMTLPVLFIVIAWLFLRPLKENPMFAEAPPRRT